MLLGLKYSVCAVSLASTCPEDVSTETVLPVVDVVTWRYFGDIAYSIVALVFHIGNALPLRGEGCNLHV